MCIKYVCVYIHCLPECVICAPCAVLTEARGSISSPGMRVSVPGHLEDQPELSTTEPSLSPSLSQFAFFG